MNIKEMINWEKLRKKKNVVGFSSVLHNKIQNGQELPIKAIRIYVSRKLPVTELKPKDLVPSFIGGYNTDIIEIGEIRAEDNKTRRRPVCAGISTMHYKGTACTVSGFFKDKETNEILIGSNNHCYYMENEAVVGDHILQPGPYDGGKDPDDLVATFYKGVKVKFLGFACPFRNLAYKIYRFFIPLGSYNRVDISFGKLEVPYDNVISLIGSVTGKTVFNIGDEVRKSGRTTELTTGKIIDTAWTGQVSYSRGTAMFEDCYLVEGNGFSAGGDSGSPVVKGTELGGILFAGSDTHTIVCKIQNIEKEGNVEYIPGV